MRKLINIIFVFLAVFIISLCNFPVGSGKIPDKPQRDNSVDFTIGSNNEFTIPVNISKNTGSSECPAFAMDRAGNIYVVWIDFFYEDYDHMGHHLFFSRSTDKGANWSKAANISDIAVNRWIGFFSPAIAVDNTGNIYVVWVDYSFNDRDIYFSRLARNSTGWSKPYKLSPSSEKAANPAITLDRAGNIYVVWYNYVKEHSEISFRRSTDNGFNWSKTVNINKDGDSNPYKSAIAVDSTGIIYVVWTEYIGYSTWFEVEDIFFSRSRNNGRRWRKAVNISEEWNNTYSYYCNSPEIAVDNDGNINVVWNGGDYQIVFSRSTNNGTRWSDFVTIREAGGHSEYCSYPDIAVGRTGIIYVAWCDNTLGNYDIFLSRSKNNGAGWSNAVNISDNSGSSKFPAIAVNRAGSVYLVWCDDSAGNYDIFFSRSTDK